MTDFQGFGKMPRLCRDIIITEKIDGTNAQIFITDEDEFLVGSRTRWITPEQDNFGFARWAYENEAMLREALGPGQHFGEWWGSKIQRRYGLDHKRFSLFNAGRWGQTTFGQGIIHIVPILYEGPFSLEVVDECLLKLRNEGSVAAPGFDNPEGVAVWHTSARMSFKKTLDHNDEHKFATAEDPRS